MEALHTITITAINGIAAPTGYVVPSVCVACSKIEYVGGLEYRVHVSTDLFTSDADAAAAIAGPGGMFAEFIPHYGKGLYTRIRLVDAGNGLTTGFLAGVVNGS